MTIPCGLLLSITGCLEPGSNDDSASVEQASSGGDLGTAVGTAVVSNNTTGLTNDHTPSCVPSSTAPDLAYAWTAPTTGLYTFSTVRPVTPFDYDTVLELHNFSTGASLGCNDDSAGTLQSTVSANLTMGQTIRIVVDGYGSNSGAFQLNISGAAGGVGRHYTCGYALPGFGCNNGKAHTSITAADMASAISVCHLDQPANLPDFCYVIDNDGGTSTDANQCTASWRPGTSCCNFFGSTSCPN